MSQLARELNKLIYAWVNEINETNRRLWLKKAARKQKGVNTINEYRIQRKRERKKL